eukprot:m.214929 g.214929  ORF g.214929 m.214929 type:complete len:353 (-) comp25600_c0_seq2:155-1213(-)
MPSELRLFRSLWGVATHGPSAVRAGGANANATVLSVSEPQHGATGAVPDRVLDHLQKLGYSGIEASLSDLGGSVPERRETVARLSSRGLRLVTGVYSSWVDYDGGWDDLHAPPATQLAALAAQVAQLAEVVRGHERVLAHVNVHSGGDGWELDEAVQFYRDAANIDDLLPPPAAEDRHGPRSGMAAAQRVSLSHETHRARPLGHFFTAARLLDHVPELRLTLDCSHWMVTAERLLGTDGSAIEAGLLEAMLSRVDHIHARVGSPQAPQIPPTAGGGPGWATCRRVHRDIWKRCWESQVQQGRTWVSATPEYGPPPDYTPIDVAGRPLYSIWDQTELASADLRLLHTEVREHR